MPELETAYKRIAELEAEVKLLSDLVQEVVAIGQQEHAMRLELETWLAAMRAGGEPVAEMVPCHTPSGKRVAVISRFQHLPIGTKLYTHPQPAAQDAEPDMFWDADNREIFAYDIEEIVSEYDPGQIVSIECAQRLPSFRVLVTVDEDGNSYEYLDAAIAAQGDSNE